MKIVFVILSLLVFGKSSLCKNLKTTVKSEGCYNFPQLTTDQRPGVKLTTTTNGLNYLTSVLIDLLVNEIRRFKIPDFSGSSGGASFSAWNLRLSGWIKPKGSLISLADKYLRFHAGNGYLKIQGSLRAKYSLGWLGSVSKTVDVSAQTSNFEVGMDFKIVRAAQTGQPGLGGTRNTLIRLHGFKASISGGLIGWVIDQLEPLFRSKIQSAVEGAVNKELTKIANQNIPKLLQAIPEHTDVNVKGYHIDYRLTTDPIYGTNSFVLPLNALIYADPATKPSYPYACSAMIIPIGTGKMLYMGFSQCVFNSLGYEMFHQDLFNQVTTPTLPSNIQETIDQMGIFPPGCRLALQSSTACPPKVFFMNNRIGLSVTGANATIGSQCDGSNTVNHMFSGAITFEAIIWGIKFDSTSYKLKADRVEVEQISVKVLTPEGRMKRFNLTPQDIANLIENVVKIFVEEKLKEFINEGFHIPVNELGPLKLLDTSLSVGGNGIILGTNLKIST